MGTCPSCYPQIIVVGEPHDVSAYIEANPVSEKRIFIRDSVARFRDVIRVNYAGLSLKVGNNATGGAQRDGVRYKRR